MTLLDLDDAEQPMDPMLVMAIQLAFRHVSLTNVEFAPAPRMWRKSNPTGSGKGPQGIAKANLRLTIAKRDGAKCTYCQQEFVDLDEATLDHVIPNSIVGHWQKWNLVLACTACNNLKGDQLPALIMPLLCQLLRTLAPLAPLVREQQQAQEARAADLRAKNKRENKARYKARRRQKITASRLDRQAAIEALAGQKMRPALGPAPVRAALPSGTESTR